MATNKRKEAAALFELIDKSTLKVPKHAGALKIPDWWSSKTNPGPAAPPASAPVNGSAVSSSAALPVARSIPSKAVTRPMESPAEPAAPQSRLFEPPAATDRSVPSPSIRPPAVHSTPATPPRSPSIAPPPPPAPATAPLSSSQPRQTMELAPDEDPDAPPTTVPLRETITTAPGGDSARRPFGPATMDPGNTKRGWVGGSQRKMARTPMWVVATGGVLAILVVVLLAFVMMRSLHKSKPAVASSNETSPTAGGGTSGTLLLPRPGTSQALTAGEGNRSLLPPANPVKVNPLPPKEAGTEEPAASGQGVVYGPGDVKRSPDLYYIMILSTPSKTIAERNAKFLAAHGVDVAIEFTSDNRGVMYRLLSAEGYPTLVAAEPHIKRIVQIGHETLDYKKSHRAWDDAFARKFNH